MDNQMSQQFVTMKSQLLKNTAQSTRDRIATVAGVPQHLGHLELMKRLYVDVNYREELHLKILQYFQLLLSCYFSRVNYRNRLICVDT